MRRKANTFLILLIFLFATAIPASAKYASYDQNSPYLSWGGAQELFSELNSGEPSQITPHGGYTTSSFKCAVCHSVHRASSDQSQAGVGLDSSLLDSTTGSCANCHATWGASPASVLVEVAEHGNGPHATVGSCAGGACHGSVHMSGPQSRYAIINKYNLTNSDLDPRYNLENQMDAAIANGNFLKVPGTNDPLMTINTVDGTSQPAIGEKSLDVAMKSYVTGYVCFPCHGDASRSIADKEYLEGLGAAARTGHLSTGSANLSHIPTCDGCHDAVGSATNTSLFPHANRGVNVLVGRYDSNTDTVLSSGEILSDGTNSTRFGLWMTAANYGESELALPLAGVVADSKEDWEAQAGERSIASQNMENLKTDGVCTKCHEPSGLR